MKLPKVSARIEVYWDWPMTWYKGQVVEIKPGEDEDVVLHRVEYDDGSFSWHNLKQDKWCKEPKYNLLHPQQRWKQWIPKQKDKNPAAKIVCEPEATPFPQADDRIEVYDIERDLWQKGIVIDAGTEGKGHPCVCYDDGATEWLSLNQTPWRRLPSLVQKESSQRLFSGERATFNLKYKYTSPRADSRPAPPPVKPKVHLPPFDVPTAHSPRVKPRAVLNQQQSVVHNILELRKARNEMFYAINHMKGELLTETRESARRAKETRRVRLDYDEDATPLGSRTLRPDWGTHDYRLFGPIVRQ